MALRPSLSASARRRSGSAWRLAPTRSRSSGSSCGKDSRWRQPAFSPASRPPSCWCPHLPLSCTASRRRIRSRSRACRSCSWPRPGPPARFPRAAQCVSIRFARFAASKPRSADQATCVTLTSVRLDDCPPLRCKASSLPPSNTSIDDPTLTIGSSRPVSRDRSSVKMARKLYVGNLPFSAGEAELQELFATAGAVDSVKVMRDMATGRARGFAFVEMASDEDAQKAIDKLHNYSFGGRNLTVNEARPRPERSGGFGGGGGYGGGGGRGGGGGYDGGGGGRGGRREPRW